MQYATSGWKLVLAVSLAGPLATQSPPLRPWENCSVVSATRGSLVVDNAQGKREPTVQIPAVVQFNGRPVNQADVPGLLHPGDVVTLHLTRQKGQYVCRSITTGQSGGKNTAPDA